jgi:hypothetical protein
MSQCEDCGVVMDDLDAQQSTTCRPCAKANGRHGVRSIYYAPKWGRESRDREKQGDEARPYQENAIRCLEDN